MASASPAAETMSTDVPRPETQPKAAGAYPPRARENIMRLTIGLVAKNGEMGTELQDLVVSHHPARFHQCATGGRGG